MAKNPLAQKRAYDTVRQRIQAAKSLGISARTTEDELRKIAVELATAKAEVTGKEPNEELSGQLWYVHDIHNVITSSAEEALDNAYLAALGDVPDAEDEQQEAIAALLADVG